MLMQCAAILHNMSPKIGDDGVDLPVPEVHVADAEDIVDVGLDGDGRVDEQNGRRQEILQSFV